MAYDSVRGRVVVFGGSRGTFLMEDTLEYTVTCDTVGAGHPGGGLPIGCISEPVPGRLFCVSLGGPIVSGLLLFGPGECRLPPLTLSDAAFCNTLYFFPDPTRLFLTPVSGNPGSVCFPIPDDPSVWFRPLCFQGVSQQPTCLRGTDGMAVRIQDRR